MNASNSPNTYLLGVKISVVYLSLAKYQDGGNVTTPLVNLVSTKMTAILILAKHNHLP